MTLDSVGHIPVLAAELLKELEVGGDQVVLDATVGLGGHSLRILEALGPGGRLIGVDRDETILARAQERLAQFAGRFSLHHERFSRLDAVFEREGIVGVDAIVADLGVNSAQLDDPSRGFSFREDGSPSLEIYQIGVRLGRACR